MFDTVGDAAVDAVVAEFEKKLPPDTENPAKAEIEQESGELEYRLAQLKKSIGEPVTP